MKLIENHKTKYVIVTHSTSYGRMETIRRLATDDLLNEGDNVAVQLLVSYFKNELGIDIAVKSDDEPGSECEIIIGHTNRNGVDYSLAEEVLAEEGYIIRAIGNNLLITGGDEEGTIYGVDRFIADCLEPFRKSGKDTLELPSDFDVKQDREYKIGALTIAGTPISDYVIVRGAGCTQTELTAAKLLRKYIRRACGVDLRIVTDTTAETEREIIVGKTNREGTLYTIDREKMHDEGFKIETVGGKLVIAGAELRGTLYGVYTFLETYLGYRYFEKYLIDLREQSAVDIPSGISDEQIPRFFTCRESMWDPSYDDWGDGYYVRNKMYSDRQHPDAFGGYQRVQGGHSMHYYIPEIGQFEGQPCLSSEDTYNRVMDGIRKYIAEHPGLDAVSVSQNDNGNSCQCEGCQKLKEAYGGRDTGPMIWFVNKVARQVQKEFPGMFVHTFAYMQTVPPPENIVCEDNVIVQLCSMFCCFSHSIDEAAAGACGHDYTTWYVPVPDRWHKICKHIWVWDYTTDFLHPMAPFPNFRTLYENMHFYGKRNVVGFLSQGYTGLTGEFDVVRCYVTAKMLWDPLMAREAFYAHLDEVLEHYYGPGWENIRKYIDICEEISTPNDFGCYEPSKNIVDFRPIEDELNALWDDAEAKATNYRQLRNVRRSRLQLKYQLLVNRYDERYTDGDEASRAKYVEENRALYSEALDHRVSVKRFSPEEEATVFTESPEKWG